MKNFHDKNYNWTPNWICSLRLDLFQHIVPNELFYSGKLKVFNKYKKCEEIKKIQTNKIHFNIIILMWVLSHNEGIYFRKQYEIFTIESRLGRLHSHHTKGYILKKNYKTSQNRSQNRTETSEEGKLSLKKAFLRYLRCVFLHTNSRNILREHPPWWSIEKQRHLEVSPEKLHPIDPTSVPFRFLG